MKAAAALDLESQHQGSDERPTIGLAMNDAKPEERKSHSTDATQGRQIGSDLYDDATQGRQIGSRQRDDATQGAGA